MIDWETDAAEQYRVFLDNHELRQIRCSGMDWSFYSNRSSNPAVILLPGGGGQAEDMFQLMLALEDDFRVLTLGCPEGLFHVPDITHAIALMMDDQGVRTAHILGHSLGGMFAEAFMLQYPERTDGLILANTAHYTTIRETLVRGVLTIASMLPRNWLNRRAASAFRRLLKDSPNEDFWVALMEDEFYRLTPEGLTNRINCMLGVLDYYPTKRIDLDCWNRRVLILESENETGFTQGEREALRRLYSNSSVHVFRDAGHMSLYTHPQEFAAIVHTFLCQCL